MAGDTRTDVGLTHVALPVADVERSIAFYAAYANMRVVHRRRDDEHGTSVVWLSDLTRPFVVVLIESPQVDQGLRGTWCHLGVGVASRAELERRCAAAHAEGRPVMGPIDSGYPVGYWAYVVDPDGHNLELSFGQEVGLTVAEAAQS
jgi:catechol 2,3-dioxygenase-like lactoylglutathione lyase family enzyme